MEYTDGFYWARFGVSRVFTVIELDDGEWYVIGVAGAIRVEEFDIEEKIERSE